MSNSQDTSGHERRLTRAKRLVDEALQRSQEGSGPSNWKDYLDAHAALLRAERDLAQANGEEAALEIEWKMPWDNGAPLPHVLSSGHMTLLLYHIAEPDPAWDGTYVNVVGVDTPGRIAFLELVGCYAFKFGSPNDEVFGGHPLTGKGFAEYGAYVVANSKWLDQEMRIQSVHRGFDLARWKDTRHYLLAFHDEMLECLAEDHRLRTLDMSMAEALEVAQKRLVADWGPHMIFSGSYVESACVSCGDLRSRVTPTSLLFFIWLAAGGLVVISRAHGVILEAQWWHWPVGFIGELVLTLILLSVVLWLRDALLPMPDTCPSCSEPMVHTATGFYDFAFFPSLSEVILLMVFVGLHVVFLTWLSPGEGIANGSLVTLLPFFWTPPRNAPALSPEHW